MSTTRDEILKVIRGQNQTTIAELAEHFGISPISIRHHLAALQAEGLIQSVEIRRGVGRPHLAFSLTASAQERFPTKYVQFSERLLDELKVSLPGPAIEAMFTRMAEGIAAEVAQQVEGKPIEKRLQVLVSVLGAEGFMAKWNRVGENIHLTEYNCPYIHIGQRHPEICTIDQTLMRQVLAADVEKTNCVLNGAERCVFVITPAAQPEEILR